ncbi:hypothetical protein Shell_0499 [Staphylothermus hellenicus DSM 12710]|uniref:Uncharacterized protein n=1 Tax=Staphylothermus hellenicus (strain DSM 12710 / JCM 10830 / BK20S6-10-b1 / P8) TaxID=591019 RepID=D7DBT3_STAHD|nr:hypothetical protein Shell_0499 [Staphylothermus hellenicus DSM 12710]
MGLGAKLPSTPRAPYVERHNLEYLKFSTPSGLAYLTSGAKAWS